MPLCALRLAGCRCWAPNHQTYSKARRPPSCPLLSPVQLQQQGRTGGAATLMSPCKTLFHASRPREAWSGRGVAGRRALGCARGHRTQAPELRTLKQGSLLLLFHLQSCSWKSKANCTPVAMLANLALRAAKRGSRRGEGRRMLFEGMLEGGIAAVGRGGRVPRLPKKGEVSKVVDLNNARTC